MIRPPKLDADACSRAHFELLLVSLPRRDVQCDRNAIEGGRAPCQSRSGFLAYSPKPVP
jgi:hypothetical protein